jgi:hypothetical protein
VQVLPVRVPLVHKHARNASGPKHLIQTHGEPHHNTRHDTTRHDTTRHDTTRHGTTRRGATRNTHAPGVEVFVAAPAGPIDAPFVELEHHVADGVGEIPPHDAAFAVARGRDLLDLKELTCHDTHDTTRTTHDTTRTTRHAHDTTRRHRRTAHDTTRTTHDTTRTAHGERANQRWRGHGERWAYVPV